MKHPNFRKYPYAVARLYRLPETRKRPPFAQVPTPPSFERGWSPRPVSATMTREQNHLRSRIARQTLTRDGRQR